MAGFRWIGWLTMVMFTIAAEGASPSDPPAYYLLIDLSPRMAAREPATRRAVEDLVRTGIHGRMEEGEKLRIAFFEQSIDPNQSTLEWDSRRALELSKQAVQTFAGRKYTRAGSLEKVVSGLQTLFPHIEKFTTLILTDGFQPMVGTPFDAELNQQMVANRNRFARANRPFLITLLARKGRWEAFGIHTDLEGKVELPSLPPDQDTLEKALAVLRGASPESLPEKPKPIVKAPEPEKPKVETPPPPKTEEPVVVAKIPDPFVIPDPPKKVEPIAPPPAVVVEQPKPTPKPEPPPEAPKVVAVVEEKRAEPKVEEPAPVLEPLPKPQPQPQTVAVAMPPPDFPWPILLAGFGIIAAGGAAIYLRAVQPKPKPPGSLISQSLDSRGRPRRPVK